MEISVSQDTLTTITSFKSFGQGFSKLLLNRQGNSYTSNSSSEYSVGGLLRTSAVISTIDAIAPPPVKSSSIKTLPRRMLRKRRRTKRKSSTGDDGNDDGEQVFGFSDEGFDAGGPFDSNGGTGDGGKGWNFGGFGGSDWGEFFSNNSDNDPAFDFVFEVLSWIVFSNCLDFAYKKVMKIVADGGLANASREKFPMRLAPVY